MAGLYSICECGSYDCPGCDDSLPPEEEAAWITLDEMGPEPARAFPSADEVEEVEALHADTVENILAGTMDPRDLTPPPPAYLDPWSVRNMQAMVRDAGANGDRPWPYARDAA